MRPAIRAARRTAARCGLTGEALTDLTYGRIRHASVAVKDDSGMLRNRLLAVLSEHRAAGVITNAAATTHVVIRRGLTRLLLAQPERVHVVDLP